MTTASQLREAIAKLQTLLDHVEGKTKISKPQAVTLLEEVDTIVDVLLSIIREVGY